MQFPQIFSGVRVLDFSRLLPGPLASDLLIRMGATVQCVVPHAADPFLGNYSPFEKLRAGKTFFTLDLKNSEDRHQALEMARNSPIVLEGFRPGAMDRLGLGFEDLKKVRSDVLYVSLTGYAEQHPRYRKGGHDLNFLIDSGVYSLLFSEESEEIPLLQLADVIGGFSAVMQILAYWSNRSQDPRARHLKVSFTSSLELLSDYLKDPSIHGWIPSLTGASSRYRIYRTSDGHRVMVAAIEEKFYQNLLDALGLRVQDSDLENIRQIETAFSRLSLEECKAIFKEVDACVSFIPSRDEVLMADKEIAVS